ncbi:MAG: DEAD/DEAH box helicase [Gemmatimonadetes bacterium]|nr:DEAD/DEAH box helicase [Gemmatimonadota bacterium]
MTSFRHVRDHFLPPDPDAFRRREPRTGRIIVIAPTRAACETIENALSANVQTVLEREHGSEIRQLADERKGFGIVAGTGTGKTLAIRPIAETIIDGELRVGVVNREREATPETPSWNVVIVTTGIARRWFQDDLIDSRDTLVVDEIHQTSAELELCLALGKRKGCCFIWLSATVDATFYREYLESSEVLETSAFDPTKAADVDTLDLSPNQYFRGKTMRALIAGKRGVAVFLPTRAEVEQLADEVGDRWGGLVAAFYHGGEPIRVVRPFLDGEVQKPFLLAMTAAGQSALNIPGLDTVIISDSRFRNVIEQGRNVLTRSHLGSNEILQMAGRVHGRVNDGKVVILTDRDIDFASLKPSQPEFQLAGDSERVALTAAALGINLEDLELPVRLDRKAYREAVNMLTKRGIIDDGRLTSYGREVEAMPVDRAWAEILVQMEEQLLPYVSVAANVDSIHRMTRDDVDIGGLIVDGSDHLTAYNIYAEAVRGYGSLGMVYRLPRHVFDEEMDEWAESRGVLVKVVEDIALGMASVYRTLERDLPATLPHVDNAVLRKFTDLVARVMPFDLVVDEELANGQRARVGRDSSCNRWGAVAGTLSHFAGYGGRVHTVIEGTSIPMKLLETYAAREDPTVEVSTKGKKSALMLSYRTVYHGFELNRYREPLKGSIPEQMQDAAVRELARALIFGSTPHPDQRAIHRTADRLREYWLRSGGQLASVSSDEVAGIIAKQLMGVTSWEDFLQTPLTLDIDPFISRSERSRLDALPDKVSVGGRVVAVEYGIEDGNGVATVVLRDTQLGKLRSRDLPKLDRPLRIKITSGRRGSVVGSSLSEVRNLLRKERIAGVRSRRHRRRRH